MTVYNAGSYLNHALSSLSAQEFENFEVIVLVHGTVDESVEVLRAWNDPRMVLEVLEGNIGRTPALNNCLKRASGEYVAVLDADDVATDNRLAAQVEFLNSNADIGLVGTWTRFIDENGRYVGESHPPTSHEELINELAFRNPIVHSSMMFRRSIAIEIGGYDESYRYAQDAVLLVEFAKRSKVAVIDEEMCFWRTVTTNLTNRSDFSVVRACDDYRLFKRIALELDFTGLTKLRNLRQRLYTYTKFRLVLLQINQFSSIDSWIKANVFT